MIIWVQPYLLRKNFDGITLWPFIILRTHHLKSNKVFLNHENIHLRQQMELLVIFFYIWYGTEFLIRWLKMGNRHLAYRHISFEREAYIHEGDLSYLCKRKVWSFLQYL